MSGAPVAIIDSGGANIASLKYAFDRLNVATMLTTDAEQIRNSERVILPGVGAARDAMERLHDAGLVAVIRELEQPVLGICLGMQLLAEGSEEDDVECLGIIPGIAKRLPDNAGMAVPNMGWASIMRTSDHALLEGLDDGSYFYFLHSYALPPSGPTIATAEHAESFSAMVAHRNFVAAQFHPERSSAAGARLLQNFIGLTS
jgi:glutamine amidotransferase